MSDFARFFVVKIKILPELFNYHFIGLHFLSINHWVVPYVRRWDKLFVVDSKFSLL